MNPKTRTDELSDLYDQYDDEALLELATEELTSEAQAVMNELIEVRGLSEALKERKNPLKEVDGSAELVVWSGDTIEEAIVASDSLSSSSIKARAVETPRNPRHRRFEILVDARDAEYALELLRTGITPEAAREYIRELATEVPALPVCSRCSSQAVVLVAASGKGNLWKCEDCGHGWTQVLIREKNLPSDNDQVPKTETWDDPSDRLQRSNRRKVILCELLNLFLVAAWWEWPLSTSKLTGLFCFVIFSLFWAAARWQLGASFTTKPEARRLVTTGLYRRIQNPIYIFGGLSTVGMALYIGVPYVWIFLIVLIPIQLWRIRRERKVLSEVFGDEYLHYRRATWF